jgi:hypothetical protein
MEPGSNTQQLAKTTVYFNDPLDPSRSLQLNNRYWKDDSFQHLDMLRQADDDVNRGRYKALRRSLGPVKSLLPPQFHRSLVSRLVYSIVCRTAFEPIRFSMTLSDEFIRLNSYEGPENEFYKPAQKTEEVRHIVDLVHQIYKDKYGTDLMSSDFSIRYMNATNTRRVTEITKYGDFSDFHLDQYTDFTCIMYLSTVGPENGCFSYIDGTGTLHKSHLLRALHGVVTFDMGLPTPDQTAELPLELRGGIGMGNFLDDEKRERLRPARVELLGKQGDGIIFNGFNTVHRGGKPVAGERTALVIGTAGRVRVRIKKYAAQLLSSLWL